MDLSWEGPQNRRQTPDRRRRRNPTLKELFVHRRRGHLRRASDRRGLVLLDFYHQPLMKSVVLVLLLSLTDAVMTLFLMEKGAIELNPIMAFFLKIGPLAFIMAKYLITAVSVVTIVVLHYIFIRRLRIYARHLLHLFAFAFSLVIVWEFVLAFRLFG